MKLGDPGAFTRFGESQPHKMLWNIPIVSFSLNRSYNLPNSNICSFSTAQLVKCKIWLNNKIIIPRWSFMYLKIEIIKMGICKWALPELSVKRSRAWFGSDFATGEHTAICNSTVCKRLTETLIIAGLVKQN